MRKLKNNERSILRQKAVEMSDEEVGLVYGGYTTRGKLKTMLSNGSTDTFTVAD